MQLAGDPSPLSLLGLNQPAAHRRKNLFGKPAIRDVDARSNVAGKRTVPVEPRHRHIEDPAVLTVMPPQPKLHLEGLARIEGSRIGIHARRHILRVNPLYPAGSQLLPKRAARSEE